MPYSPGRLTVQSSGTRRIPQSTAAVTKSWSAAWAKCRTCDGRCRRSRPHPHPRASTGRGTHAAPRKPLCSCPTSVASPSMAQQPPSAEDPPEISPTQSTLAIIIVVVARGFLRVSCELNPPFFAGAWFGRCS